MYKYDSKNRPLDPSLPLSDSAEADGSFGEALTDAVPEDLAAPEDVSVHSASVSDSLTAQAKGSPSDVISEVQTLPSTDESLSSRKVTLESAGAFDYRSSLSNSAALDEATTSTVHAMPIFVEEAENGQLSNTDMDRLSAIWLPPSSLSGSSSLSSLTRRLVQRPSSSGSFERHLVDDIPSSVMQWDGYEEAIRDKDLELAERIEAEKAEFEGKLQQLWEEKEMLERQMRERKEMLEREMLDREMREREMWMAARMREGSVRAQGRSGRFRRWIARAGAATLGAGAATLAGATVLSGGALAIVATALYGAVKASVQVQKVSKR